MPPCKGANPEGVSGGAGNAGSRSLLHYNMTPHTPSVVNKAVVCDVVMARPPRIAAQALSLLLQAIRQELLTMWKYCFRAGTVPSVLISSSNSLRCGAPDGSPPGVLDPRIILRFYMEVKIDVFLTLSAKMESITVLYAANSSMMHSHNSSRNLAGLHCHLTLLRCPALMVYRRCCIR